MAVDILKYISKSELERLRYEDEVLAEIDQEAEIDYRVKEIAMKLLKKGVPIEDIADSTNLDIDTVRESQEQPGYESDESE